MSIYGQKVLEVAARIITQRISFEFIAVPLSTSTRCRHPSEPAERAINTSGNTLFIYGHIPHVSTSTVQ
ncbi:hypothetical protein QQP08_023964 [Theobroma cacao]|nr:hypothetical protein QQP08_023964 [Theobroma cacao]